VSVPTVALALCPPASVVVVETGESVVGCEMPDEPAPVPLPPRAALVDVVDDGAGLEELCFAPVSSSFGVDGGAEAASLELLPGLSAATPLPPELALPAPAALVPPLDPVLPEPEAEPDPEPDAPPVLPDPPVPLVALAVPEYATWIGRFAIDA